MKSIIEYVKTYGDRSLNEMPFNEADSLVLCQLAYLKFDGLLPSWMEDVPGKTLAQLKEATAVTGGATDENTEHGPAFEEIFDGKISVRKNLALFEAASKSVRFGNMRLNGYINLIDDKWEIQFSALTFTFENGLLYLAYRGTDETITGWKEDFNMALLYPVPAQEKALQYLNRIAMHTNGNFLIGGHSKGGNLAVYAASKCHPDLQKRILAVYDHDGPGFPEGTLTETEGFLHVRDRIRKYIPHSSIVGMLMESTEAYTVVESRQLGIFQHDPFSWVVEGASFKQTDSVYSHTAFKNESINRWIRELTPEETQVFVDSLFSVLTASGAQTMPELAEGWKENSRAMVRAIEETDPKTREMLVTILSRLFDCMHGVLKGRAMEKLEPGIEKIREQLDKWQEHEKISKK